MSDPAAGGEQRFDRDLKSRTRRSIFWLVSEAAAEHALSFLIFVLMARVLPPAELGTLAITFVFLDVGRIVVTAGVTQRVARARDLTSAELDTLFWMNLAIAALYCAALLAVAGIAEASFGAPKLENVLQWITVPLMLFALGTTHMALRLREFGHRTLAVRTIVGGSLGAAAAVALLLLGAGIWAFVVQRGVREAVASALAWQSFRWRPTMRFDRARAAAHLRFGSDFAGAQLVAYLTLRGQDLLIGRFLGAVPLSIYRVAWRPAELLGPGMVSSFANVALQTFSRLQDSRAELRSAYTKLLRQCALMSLPALVGYGMAGPWLVPMIFGEQWRASGWIAPALIPLALTFTVKPFISSLLTSLGHVRWQRQLALLELASMVLVTLIALPFGLLWVALSYSLRSYLWLPVQLYWVRKASGIGVGDHLAALWPALLACAVMAAVVVPALFVTDPGNLLELAPVCAAGALVYGATILLLLPGESRRLLSLLNRQHSRD